MQAGTEHVFKMRLLDACRRRKRASPLELCLGVGVDNFINGPLKLGLRSSIKKIGFEIAERKAQAAKKAKSSKCKLLHVEVIAG
jgi:hypothetical protein